MEYSIIKFGDGSLMFFTGLQKKENYGIGSSCYLTRHIDIDDIIRWIRNGYVDKKFVLEWINN